MTLRSSLWWALLAGVTGCGSEKTSLNTTATAKALVVNADQTCGPTGYDLVPEQNDVANKLNWGVTAIDCCRKTDFLTNITSKQLVYFFGHGAVQNNAFVGISFTATEHLFPATDLPGGLNCLFVFLNGCQSAEPGSPGTTGFISKFHTVPNARFAYLGWTQAIQIGQANTFSTKFFDACNVGKTVGQAADAADSPSFPPFSFVNTDSTVVIDRTPNS